VSCDSSSLNKHACLILGKKMGNTCLFRMLQTSMRSRDINKWLFYSVVNCPQSVNSENHSFINSVVSIYLKSNLAIYEFVSGNLL
jgi:hypothetical protein